jgi:DnaJ domain
MAPASETRRQSQAKSLENQPSLTVKYPSSSGTTELTGKLLELNEQGITVELGSLVAPGLRVEVAGDVEGATGPYRMRRKCLVCRCSAVENGRYVVGMSFEPSPGPAGTNPAAISTDHYETLQLSRNANLDMIQRVFRILAQRYHPDNLETGNPELFREIVEAHRVLGDPEMRASYDAQLGAQTQNRFKIFDTWQNSRGVEAEKRKRQGILSLLYGKRLTEPHQPALTMREFEDMLGCPREHLEFSLWFLKENKWIVRGDNNKFEITCLGVVMAEEAEQSKSFQTPLAQLPAPQ